MAVTQRNRILIFTTNTTTKESDLTIEIEFYDANDALVGSDTDYIDAVGPSQEVVAEFYDIPSSYDHVKVYIDAEDTYFHSCYKDLSITTNDNKDKEEIIIQAKNTSSEKISGVEIGVVFYKDGKVVGYESDFDMGVQEGRSANMSVNYPYDMNFKTIDFDNFKVYVVEAYRY